MATAFKTEPAADDIVITGAMVLAEPQRGTVVLLDRAKFEPFFDSVATEARAQVFDMSTSKGREACKSYVFQNIVKVRTGIEAQANELTEEWRKSTKAVTAARGEITDRFKALAEEIRKPLTDWEEAEKARVDECRAVIDGFIASSVILETDTSQTVWDRGIANKAVEIAEARFGDMFDEATAARTTAGKVLYAAYQRLKQSEADAAELEKLRAEAAERDRIAAEEQAARDLAEKEAEAERQRLADIAAAEKAEKDRAEAEAQRIADAEQAAAEKAAQEAKDKLQREHEAELKAERDRADQIERDAQAERDRLAKIEEDRLAEEEAKRVEAARIADETAKRQADQEHRTRVKTAAKVALITCGADEETARKIVVAILAGEIPAVSLVF